jgi:hypothetical protein
MNKQIIDCGPIKNLIDPQEIPCNECSLFVDNNSGVCASDGVIEKIASFIEDKTDKKINDAEQVVEEAKKILQCDTEECILKSKEFIKTLESGEIQIIQKDLDERYKVNGPAETTQLLNNFHIDKTLESWAGSIEHFLPIEFQYIDFTKYNTELETLDIENVYKNGIRCVGCVLNTDSTGGRGKHWICVFIDMRNDQDWTIEFFNSSGNPPAISVIEWMMKIEMRMKKYKPNIHIKQVIVSRIVHQKSRTECGPYCLYFIFNRLNGVPYQEFSNSPIPDEKVTEFRKHLFK